MLKARQCTDGRQQRECMINEESTSPTVTTEAIFITSIVDAKEKQEIAVVDLPGAFLHADNVQDVIMFMQGRLAELMSLIALQTYQKFITVEKGQKVLYIKVQKALYGKLKSALLFYKKLRGDLESMGFEINPYNPCVANKIVNDHQMTIIWHVDCLKISQKDGCKITKIIT